MVRALLVVFVIPKREARDEPTSDMLVGAEKGRKFDFLAENGHCRFTPWLGEVTS